MSTRSFTRTDIAFDADGTTLRGWFYRPDTAEPSPVVVMSHGFSALKEMDLERYAEAFASSGLACLVYDHRNLGGSDGAPRGEIDPWRQILDTRLAISFAAGLPGVDSSRIGLWGTSRRVKCVVFQAGTIDSFAAVSRRTSPDALAALRERFAADMQARVAGAQPEMIAVAEPGSDSYRYLVEGFPDLGYPNRITLRSRDLALGYVPGAFIERIAPTPLLMIVAGQDELTPADMQIDAYGRAGEPKRLLVLDGARHYDVYNLRFDETSAAALDWFLSHLN
jgi:fermentation-respiration switch protein FrsA (DUF1100 family)